MAPRAAAAAIPDDEAPPILTGEGDTDPILEGDALEGGEALEGDALEGGDALESFDSSSEEEEGQRVILIPDTSRTPDLPEPFPNLLVILPLPRVTLPLPLSLLLFSSIAPSPLRFRTALLERERLRGNSCSTTPSLFAGTGMPVWWD